MVKYGLIGYPLVHSFSQSFFTEKFQQEGLLNHAYELFPLQNISDLPELIESEPELCGLNVTIPHKISAIYYMDSLDKVAKKIGAINCIKLSKSKPVESYFSGELSSMKMHLKGYNTDAYGFEVSLFPLLKPYHHEALILGNGGAARAVIYVLKKLNIKFKVVSRRPINKQIHYHDLNEELIKKSLLIVNTTPLGLYPDVNQCPDIPYEYLSSKHLLYDAIYNPEETEFLKRGKAQGASIKNGLEMLYLQAEKSWEIWNANE